MFFSRIAVPLALSMVAFGLVESFANRRTDLDVDTTAGRALLEQAGQGITYQPGVLSETEDENGLILSKGLKAKVIAQTGMHVPLLNYGFSSERFHEDPDAGAVFASPNGDGSYVYVSNSEQRTPDSSVVGTSRDWVVGGVGAIYFNKDGEVINYKKILTGTQNNCGGGKTPWGTWLTAEEFGTSGQVWEVDPWGKFSHITLMGGEGGNYESVAYDNREGKPIRFFLTDDTTFGELRRFTPDDQNLKTLYKKTGTTEYLVLENVVTTGTILDEGTDETTDDWKRTGTFRWSTILEEGQQSAGLYFRKAEGIDARNGIVYFVAKDSKVLVTLDLDAQTFVITSTVSGAFNRQPDQIATLTGDDNILYFCEDGGDDCGLHGRDSSGKFFTILDGPAYDTETTGLAFSPDKKRAYIAFQSNPGRIFEITRIDGKAFDAKSLDIKYHA